MLPRLLFPCILVASLAASVASFTSPEPAIASGREESTHLTRVGAWPFGSTYSVAVDTVRQLAFLGSGGAVLVLDAVDPDAPLLVSDEIRTFGRVVDIFYDRTDRYLYLACDDGGLEIWDVADPAQPERLSSTEVLYFGYETPVGDVEVYGDYAIVECAWGYVRSLDVSDPTDPFQVGVNGSMGNPAYGLHVSQADGQAHTTGQDGYRRLRIQPNGQLEVSHGRDFLYGAFAVFGEVDVAYVSYGGAVWLLDLYDPFCSPWSVIDLGGIAQFVKSGPLLYITNSNGLHIYNVASPASPYHVGTLPSSLYFDRVALASDHAYLTAIHSGLHIADVSDPAQPALVGEYDVYSEAWDVALDGDLAYVAHADDGLLVLDISDLTRPELIGELDTPSYARAVSLDGDRVYIGNTAAGLRVVDVSTPTAPFELGAWTGAEIWCVLADGAVVYAAESVGDAPCRLFALDVTDAAQIVALDEIVVPDRVDALELLDGYLYVADDDAGVRIIDVSAPDQLSEVGSIAIPSAACVLIDNGKLYVTSSDTFDGGLFVYDLSDPAAPALLGSYEDTAFSPDELAVSGDWAYAVDTEDLHLLSVADPAAILHLDTHRLPYVIVTAAVARDEYVFVANGSCGLQVVENLLYDDPGGGVAWEQVDSGTTQTLYGVHFADPARGWAVGAGGTILHSTDGGATWAPQGSGTAAALADVCFVDAEQGWVVGAGGTILHSADGGGTWSAQSSGTGATLNSVDFVDAGKGWAVGSDGTILHTADGGATWLPQASNAVDMLASVSFADAQHGLIAGNDVGEILRTVNGGASWTTVQTGAMNLLFAVSLADANTGWAVGMFGEIQKTTNGGITWIPQDNPHPPDWLYDVVALDENSAWAVGFDGKIITTADGGDVWAIEDTGINEQLEAVHALPGGFAWAVGEAGTILRRTGGITATPVEGNVSLPAQLALNSCPNPFNPHTTLRYALQARTQVVLAIFDVRGAQVRTLVDAVQDAGNQAATWDGRDNAGHAASSGVYLATLRAGNDTAIRRLVLIR